jgi:hypothetical protein
MIMFNVELYTKIRQIGKLSVDYCTVPSMKAFSHNGKSKTFFL